MKKFIVIYHTPTEAAKQMATVSKEDQAKGMEGWMVWAQKCGDKLVDMGGTNTPFNMILVIVKGRCLHPNIL
ncbi:MAG: hypothetical protein JJE09_10730 [Bacteroidia bacterium]|nr:hypothetical protein [Bacteroidia bacterium]